jgi:hypothetical protein
MNAQVFRARLLIAASTLAIAAVTLPAADLHVMDSRFWGESMRETLAQSATLQMQTYRWEIDAALKHQSADRARYEQAARLVRDGEFLVVRLRSAHSNELQAVRTLFDRNREELDRVLGRLPERD